MKLNGRITERLPHMLMRVACGIHSGDLAEAIETYEFLSRRRFMHATSKLFNAGMAKPQTR